MWPIFDAIILTILVTEQNIPFKRIESSDANQKSNVEDVITVYDVTFYSLAQ